jgi:DNA invertase Pin-like site-specific DNA recombinase
MVANTEHPLQGGVRVRSPGNPNKSRQCSCSRKMFAAAIRARKLDVIVVYKVDRLTRSQADFAKLVELFDAHGVSFVSVTQQFNTTTSMGRLTLNVLLSFAQFEREVSVRRLV